MKLDNIFKVNDIRGIYPDELNDEVAFKIGQGLVSYLHPQEVCVGRDVRLSSEPLFKALSQGIITSGVKVINLGVVTTDMFYFAMNKYNFDAGIMITASHNPSQDNGFKICRKGGIMVYQDNGLDDLEQIVGQGLSETPTSPGLIVDQNITSEYLNHLLANIDLKQINKLKVGLDISNGSLGFIIKKIINQLPIEAFIINDIPDGTFPNHSPDPQQPESLVQLQKLVLDNHLDFGVIFDGDADRVVFLDNKGEVINASIILVLLIKHFLFLFPNSKVVYDSAVSKIVPEAINKYQGQPVRSLIGHSFMKANMREYDAIVGGEHTGHFYFKNHYYSDSGLMTFLVMLNILSDIKKPFSVLKTELYPYYHSQEKNYPKETNYQDKLNKIIEYYHNKGLQVENFDGFIINDKNYWIHIHPANTGPHIRTNIEADSLSLLKEKEIELNNLFL